MHCEPAHTSSKMMFRSHAGPLWQVDLSKLYPGKATEKFVESYILEKSLHGKCNSNHLGTIKTNPFWKKAMESQVWLFWWM